jgi:hypothetical protein
MKNLLLALLGFLPLLSYAQNDRSFMIRTESFSISGVDMAFLPVVIGIEKQSDHSIFKRTTYEVGYRRGTYLALDPPEGSSQGIQASLMKEADILKIWDKEIKVNMVLSLGLQSILAIEELTTFYDENRTLIEDNIHNTGLMFGGYGQLGLRFDYPSYSMTLYPLSISLGLMGTHVHEDGAAYFTNRQQYWAGLSSASIYQIRFTIPFSTFKTKHIKASQPSLD